MSRETPTLDELYGVGAEAADAQAAHEQQLIDDLVALVQEVLRAGNANTRAIKQAMGATWSRRAREVVERATSR